MGSAVDLMCNAHASKSLHFNWTINGTHVSPFMRGILSVRLKSRHLTQQQQQQQQQHSLLLQGLLRLHRLMYNASYICTVYDETCSRSTSPITLYITEESIDTSTVNKTYSTSNTQHETYIHTMILSVFIFLLIATVTVVWHSFRK